MEEIAGLRKLPDPPGEPDKRRRMVEKLLEKHVLLRHRDIENIHEIDAYLANDGGGLGSQPHPARGDGAETNPRTGYLKADLDRHF